MCEDCYNVETTPCGTEGCLETHKSNCIIYNGGDLFCDPLLAAVIEDGLTLSEVISNLNARICELTPTGQDWSVFNYQCLRQDGSLDSVGATNIGTAKEFAEATSIALCNIHTRLEAVEVPTITVGCTSLISGTSTLSEILNELISRSCSSTTSLDFSGITASCFTSVPVSTTINDWIQWVVDNVCTFKTAWELADTNMDTRVDAIELRLNDFDNAAYTCISGAANNQTLETTITNIQTKICSMDTDLDSVMAGTNNLTLTYSACITGTATQSVTDHFNNIINQIELYTVGSGLTMSGAGCAKVIALDPAYIFSCSDLNTCSINDLANVNTTTEVTYDLLGFNGTTWVPFEINVTSTDTSVSVTRTNSVTGITFDLSVATASVTKYLFTANSPNVALTTVFATAGSDFGAFLEGNTVILDVIVDMTNLTWVSRTWETIGTVSATVTPSKDRFFQATILNNISPSYGSHATIGRVLTTGAVQIFNPVNSSLAPSSPDTISVSISVQSYQL